MKKFSVWVIVFMVALFITSTGYCEDNKARIYFGNGMLNDEKGAGDSLKILKDLIGKEIKGTELEGKTAYKVSHNPTGGVLEDFFESVSQIIDINMTRFWRCLAGLDAVPDYFQEKYMDFSASIDKAMIEDYESIQDHVIYNLFLTGLKRA